MRTRHRCPGRPDLGALRHVGPEGEQRLAGVRLGHIEPHRTVRRVVARQHARRGEPFTLTGEAKIHDVDLRLGWPAGVQATLLDAHHEPLTGSWVATLMSDGWSKAISGSGSALAAQLPDAGRYVIAVNHSGSRAAAWVSVDVANDTVTQVGEIVISEVVGAFAGDGNSVVALGQPAPGETVEIRTEFAATVAVRGAQLRLAVPAGWELLPAGTLLDGSTVTARSGLGGLTVPEIAAAFLVSEAVTWC